MHRRHVLKGLLGLAGLISVAPSISAKTAPQTLRLQASHVAGFQYHQGEHIWPLMSVGDTLHVAREATNPYDAYVVRLDWQGHKLGYVPRSQNLAAACLLDQGKVISARIVELNASAVVWKRVAAELWLEV